jgi:parallel beta-helix repeat protein
MGFGRRADRRLCTVAVVFIVAVALTSAPASASSGTLYITSDTTLTENHYGSIVIAADDVTLECAGFSVIGPNSEGGPDDGIFVAQHSGLTIENCTVRGFASHGFELQWVTNSTLVGNTANGNAGSGFDINDATNVSLRSNRAMANQMRGFWIYGGQALTLTGNTANSNGFSLDFSGFEAHASGAMTWSRTASIGNAGFGFTLAEGSSGNVLDKNLGSNNRGPNFGLEGIDNLYTGNLARGGPSTGFFIIGTSSGNELRGNVAKDMAGYGYALGAGTTGTTLSMNQATGNGYEGFIVFSSTHNRLVGNTSSRNYPEGISLYYGADNNAIRGNLVTNNGNSGILAVQSSGNVIANNRAVLNNTHLLDNGGGISLTDGSSYNFVTENVACRNGNADGYDDHSETGNTWEANQFCTSDI